MSAQIRNIISDSEVREIKSEMAQKISEIFNGLNSIEDKRDSFWHHIVESGWSSGMMKSIIQREENLNGGTTYSLLLQVEGQYMEEVMSDLGYEVSDGFC